MDVFNSLTNINERIDKIIYDRHFTSHLILFRGSLNDGIYRLYDTELDRLLYQILPKIHANIKWLSLEGLSVERILDAATYPTMGPTNFPPLCFVYFTWSIFWIF